MIHSNPIVPFIVPVHVVAGLLALVFGYAALFAAKGQRLHRKAGIAFVYAMVTMSLTGALMDALDSRQVSVNVVAGLVTFYFVTTALLAVRPVGDNTQRIHAIAMLFGLVAVALAFTTSGPGLMFGIVGMVAMFGDFRMLRAGGIAGRRRIARHLWRMCFAMWVAAASFFWGPPRRVPEMIRIPPLLAIAVLTPIAVMLYWLWRVRARKTSLVSA